MLSAGAHIMLPIRSTNGSFPNPHRRKIELLERDSCELAIGVGIGVRRSAVVRCALDLRCGSAKRHAAQQHRLEAAQPFIPR